MASEEQPVENAVDTPSSSPDAAAAHIAIPPLSDAFQTLLELGESDKRNLRVIELVCWKDPSAVARIIAHASVAGQSGSAPARRPAGKPLSLGEALALIGARAAYDLLVSMWGVDAMTATGFGVAERDYLAKHIFMMFATALRVVNHAEVGEQVPVDELLLLVMVDQLSLALAFSPDADQACRQALVAAIAAGRHAFHRIPELAPIFRSSRAITKSWGLSGRLDGYLATLDHWRLFASVLPPTVSVVLCSEAILEAAEIPEFADMVRKELPEVDPVARELIARGIDPVGLAVRY